MRLSDFLDGLGRWYQYSPRLAICLGGVNRAVFISNLLERLSQTTDPRGVYKTQAEIEQETGLTKAEQDSTRRALRSAGILIEKYARLDHRMFYQIDRNALDDLWDEFSRNQKSRFRETEKPALGETAKVDVAMNGKADSIRQRLTSKDSLNLFADAKQKGGGKRNWRTFPDDFQVTDKMRQWAIENGYRSPDIVFEAFRDHYLKNGRKFMNWTAAFRDWIRKDTEDPIFRAKWANKKPGREFQG